MSSHEIEGELLDSFCIAWETPDPIDVTHRAIATEMGHVLEEKLQDVIRPHEAYAVSVIITKLENRNASSQRKESEDEERILRECAA